MVKIIDTKELKETIEEMLDKGYGSYIDPLDRNRVTIYASLGDYPIAQVKYNDSNYDDIIIKEAPWEYNKKRGRKEHLKFLEQHRPKLREIADALELKAQREGRTSMKVVYINYTE